jgi:hypothetical protein
MDHELVIDEVERDGECPAPVREQRGFEGRAR